MITHVWFWAILSFVLFVAAYQIVVSWKEKWRKFAFVFEEYSDRFTFFERCNKYFQFFHKPLVATMLFGLFSFVTIAGYNASMSTFSGEAMHAPYQRHAESEAAEPYVGESMAEASAYEEPEPVMSEKVMSEEVECLHPEDDEDCDSHDVAVEAAEHFQPVDIYTQPVLHAPDDSTAAETEEASARE